MNDIPPQPSPFRHQARLVRALAVVALLGGITLRCLAVQGELWLDELWSLLNVINIHHPTEIFTTLKHDNNHLLNSLWLWLMGPYHIPVAYRFPSLVFSIGLLVMLFRLVMRSENPVPSLVWFLLIATSYPVTLYCTEARGYSLAVFMSVIGYLSLTRLLEVPSDTRAMVAFSVASIIGCVSHAIFILFLAPSIVWVGYCMITATARLDSRKFLRIAIFPPALAASILTLTFYTGMEIGGAPLLPYLEVAASTISVSFGGEPLSASSPSVTGWSTFLAVLVVTVCVSELFVWARSKDPLAVLVFLILITPWVAVLTLQPHFILPRYFLIQIVFSYLLLARFSRRLLNRNVVGKGVAILLLLIVVVANTRHTYQLWSFGRSHLLEIFLNISTSGDPHGHQPSVGGDQDFQNSLRLRYATQRGTIYSWMGDMKPPPGYPVRLTYVPSYRTDPNAPRFVIRETLDAFETLPPSFTLPSGVTYTLTHTFKAPPLSGSHVYVYKLSE